MTTTIAITAKTGESLGTVATVEELATVIKANPGATYDISVGIENPCHLHPAFEADNCPACGTNARLG